MRIPQTAERIKEVPAQALRAVFAGVGQVLLIGERVRRRSGGEGQDSGLAAAADTASGSAQAQAEPASHVNVSAPAKDSAPAKPSAPAKASAPLKDRAPAKASAPAKDSAPAKASAVKDTASKAAKTTAAKSTGTKTSEAKATAPKKTAASALPVPNYSELSVASLRARLRNLDVAQVRELISYERDHEGRENVIAMFERRIAKLEEPGDSGAAKG